MSNCKHEKLVKSDVPDPMLPCTWHYECKECKKLDYEIENEERTK